MFTLLNGCSWDSGSNNDTTSSRNIEGAGVKGPLANAIVNVYAFDATKPYFKGDVAATVATDDSSALVGLTSSSLGNPPYIIEFTSDAGTTDITTGMLPVIGTMRSVITQTKLDNKDKIYASPLTTMAVDIAISQSTTATTAADFEVLLAGSAKQVVSTLGFGMPDSIDIFDTPPLIDSTTTTGASQGEVAAYRSAIEAVTAIAFEMEKQSTGDVQTVLSELSMDLADGVIDGMIDGNSSAVFSDTALDVLAQTPESLVIPNTDPPQSVSDIHAMLVAEKAITLAATDTAPIEPNGAVTTTTTPAQTSADTDGDGTLNIDDAFPSNAAEITDSDNDGIGNNADTDDDNDGILDVDEGSTPAPTETDTDGDGILNAADNCSVNFNSSQTDTDDDGEGDVCDTDDDGDGTLDVADLFPTDSSEQTDADNDGIGDNADLDDDNDNQLDTAEDLVGNGDSDNDGIPNREDIDSDNDGLLDIADTPPYDDQVTFDLAPVSVSANIVTDEDSAVGITLTTTEAESGLSYTVTTGPSNGALTGVAPNLSYTPSANYNGSDSISFTATDAAGQVSNTASISITVAPVNDLPSISGVPATAIVNGAAYTFTPTAADVDGQDLLFSIQNMPVWATFTPADGTLSGTPPLSTTGNGFSNIIISVTSGSDTVALPAFAINQASTGPAGAVWDGFNWNDGSTWQ